MKLADYLKQCSAQKLSKIADKHQIYYGADFSKLWISDKIEKKLLDKEHIIQIIKEKLNPQAVKIIKQLINNESINKNRLGSSTYKELEELGLIYEKNNSYQIPQDIKELLKNEIELSNYQSSNKKSPSNSKTISKSSSTQVKINRQMDLSFYDYVILTLSYLKDENNNYSNLKEYLKQINFTNLSNQQLVEYILTYCQQFDLLTSELKLTSSTSNWLNLPYPKLVLQSLDIFYPHSQKPLRQIIAILIHYSLQESFTIDFLNRELDLEILNKDEDKELLELLNIFLITDNKLQLTPFCWHLFNSQFETILNKPQTDQDKIIVNPPIPRQKFWEICNNASLTRVDEGLIFQVQKNAAKKD